MLFDTVFVVSVLVEPRPSNQRQSGRLVTERRRGEALLRGEVSGA